MEIVVIALCLTYVLRDPAATLKAAAEYRRAKQTAPTHAPRSARRPGALRGFLWTVWDTHWNEAARRYPERMARARERREQRRAKRREWWQQVQAEAGQRWDRRHGTTPAPAPAPVEASAGPGGATVIDLAERRTAKTTPEAAPSEKAAPAEEQSALQEEAAPAEKAPGEAAEQPPVDTDTVKKEETVDLSDSATLSAHLGALGSQADYLDRVSADMERLAAGMRAHDMGEAAVGAVDAAREAEREAAAALRAAAEALREANAGVAEAYAAHRDAADGHYQTGQR